MPSVMDDDGDMDEAGALVPWYVGGNLDKAGVRLIEELALQDEEFARLIEEARQEAQAIASLNEAPRGPYSALWVRIEMSLERERQARSGLRPAKRAAGLKGAVSSIFAGLPVPQWRALAAAAVAICVIEAGAIGYLAGGADAPAKFHAASGPQAETSPRHSAFIVSFWDTATIAEVDKALGDAGAVVADGPDADMLYRLALRNDSVEAKDRAYAKLRASGLVKLILPVK